MRRAGQPVGGLRAADPATGSARRPPARVRSAGRRWGLGRPCAYDLVPKKADADTRLTAEQYRVRLKLYEAKKPYRETPK